MSGVKHTPGPWVQVGWGPYGIRAGYSQSSVGTSIAHVSKGPAEFDANARLIASAPDLLKALELLTEEVEEYELGNPDVLRKARAAVARAKGE